MHFLDGSRTIVNYVLSVSPNTVIVTYRMLNAMTDIVSRYDGFTAVHTVFYRLHLGVGS